MSALNLLNSGGAQIATMLTDAQGYYLFNNLNPGTYTVRIRNTNFDQSTDPLYEMLSSTGNSPAPDPDDVPAIDKDDNGE